MDTREEDILVNLNGGTCDSVMKTILNKKLDEIRNLEEITLQDITLRKLLESEKISDDENKLLEHMLIKVGAINFNTLTFTTLVLINVKYGDKDIVLRKVLDITLKIVRDIRVVNINSIKLQDIKPSEKSSLSKYLDALNSTLCRGVKFSNLTKDTYVLIDKVCCELAWMKDYELSDAHFKIFEHMLINGIEFNKLSETTLHRIGHYCKNDFIRSKLRNGRIFKCSYCELFRNKNTEKFTCEYCKGIYSCDGICDYGEYPD